MIGHGCPTASIFCPAAAAKKRAVGQRGISARIVLYFFLAYFLSHAFAAAEELRIRLAWGGGKERQWQGTVTLSEGRMSEPRLLGIEADETGSMWLESDGPADPPHLVIRARSARNYDGVDLRVNAPLSATLTVTLAAADESDTPAAVAVPLKAIVEEFFTKEIDGQGNRLLAVRTPGDQLLVSFDRDALLFTPGEPFRFAVEPNALPLAEGAKVKLKAQLFPAAGGKEIWSDQEDFVAGKSAAIPLEAALPYEEGAYDVILSLVGNTGLSQAVRRPLQWNKTLVERRIQVLVLDSRRPPAGARGDRQWSEVLEIDPANPRWWEIHNKLPQLQQLRQLQLPRINRLLKAPLGNGMKQTCKHALGEFVQLKPNDQSPDASWEAYALPISQPGRPHVLEVEYPSDLPQTLGISIVEPNAAGGISPIGQDSGIDVRAPLAAAAGPPRTLKHRLIFWPRTNAPLAMLTNLRDHAPAVYGKIRVLVDGERLARAALPPPKQGQRLIAAYLDRPLIPENFAAAESFDAWSGRCLDDWNTFYEGGSRLVEYLQHVGYNGLMLAVYADGSTIYPSALVEPGPRYDTGMFFSTGQDPVRKDYLELLLRLFDREGLQLIPTLEFASPLPELEALRRGGGAKNQGLEWIGPDGKPYAASRPPQRGLAPYYNVLDTRVQQAMLAVAQELIDRYAGHPSFGGLALRLSSDGYAQLPGPEWGLDDATIARFERDAKIRVPGEGPRRFAARAEFLAGEKHRRAWLEWRAAELGKFHLRLREALAAVRPDAKLYLAGADALGGTELESELRPALPRRATLAEALLRVGIDERNYRGDPRLVLLRPEKIAPAGELNAIALELELAGLPDADRYFQGLPATGSLFFHPPREMRIESFDAQSPIKPSRAWLVAQTSASEKHNRRRFVQSIAALDAQAIFDGGWLLPMGQEDSIRELVAAFRALPAIKFRQIADQQNSSQPVTFRAGVHAGRTYLYAVNDAPFGVTAKIRINAAANCRMEELSGLRKIDPPKPDADGGTVWEVRLEPYDLVAVQLSDSAAQLARPQVAWPDEIESALALEIRKLGARAAALRTPPLLTALENADFEEESEKSALLPGWTATAREGVAVSLDRANPHGGKQAAKIQSDGPIACLASRLFPAPATGRLSMAVWLRIDAPGRQPPFRLAVEGKLNGRDYYRYAQVGLHPEGAPPTAAFGKEWEQFIFQVDDLPLTGLSPLRVRFDLMGEGEVWIDDVQLYNLSFSKPEIVELSKLITLADLKLQYAQLGDCVRLLEGYWPRFLDENVPLPATVVAKRPPAKPTPPKDSPAESAERTGFMDRVKNLIPDSLRF
ncbi:MAG: hypothetical protein IT426_18620 [Pirellulales bacterium]|nr:hypothetical protein [Pirellulales bacterium]